MAPPDDNQTYEIGDVEIFRVGTWNGDRYSVNDLDSIVKNFDSLREKIKPPVKLGHNEDQELLVKDGLPAAGWITGLKRIGDRLIATIKHVPKVIYEIVKNRGYARVSSEIYPNYQDNGINYGPVLRAIAFLGSDIPSVDSLADIRSIYKELYKDGFHDFKIYQYSSEPTYKFIVSGIGRLHEAPRRITISRKRLLISIKKKGGEK